MSKPFWRTIGKKRVVSVPVLKKSVVLSIRAPRDTLREPCICLLEWQGTDSALERTEPEKVARATPLLVWERQRVRVPPVRPFLRVLANVIEEQEMQEPYMVRIIGVQGVLVYHCLEAGLPVVDKGSLDVHPQTFDTDIVD